MMHERNKTDCLYIIIQAIPSILCVCTLFYQNLGGMGISPFSSQVLLLVCFIAENNTEITQRKEMGGTRESHNIF